MYVPLTFQDALTAVMLVKLVQVWISVHTYSGSFTCMHSTRETYEKEANELHIEAALQDLNGQTDIGTINDKLCPTLNN